jgi:iron complex transport system substrate-binding protein
MTLFSSRRLALAQLLGVVLLPMGGAMAAGAMAIPHAQGETSLPATPTRVVSYDLASLDILNALGVPVAGVPAVRMPASLAAFSAESHPKVGTLFEPDEAALRATRPELIIVGGRSARRYAALGAIAPTIDLSTRPEHFLADVKRNIRTLGRIFGRDAQAEALVKALEADVAALHAKSAKAGMGLMLFVAGPGMNVQAPGSRFGYLYDLYGIRSVVTAAEAPAAPAAGPAPAAGSPEAAAQAQARRESGNAFLATALGRKPDWIFVLDRPSATGGEPVSQARLEASAAVKETPAWKNQRVIMLDAPEWYLVGGGITGLRASLAQFSVALG